MVRNGSVVFSAVALALLALSSPAQSGDSTFATFEGVWSGSGTVKLENGKSERLKCKGYYTAKSGGSGLGMAINCGNPSFKINMRANLMSAAGQISGNWEEREFNQAGDVSGKSVGSGFNLKISGAISGSMSVTLEGSNQSVSISTGGPGFTGVSLQFSKSS